MKCQTSIRIFDARLHSIANIVNVTSNTFAYAQKNNSNTNSILRHIVIVPAAMFMPLCSVAENTSFSKNISQSY